VSDRLYRVLRALIPECPAMAEDLAEQGEDAEFVAAQLREYLTADAASQADMRAFHDSDGVEKVKDAIVWAETRRAISELPEAPRTPEQNGGKRA
jgi:hypothetical protein